MTPEEREELIVRIYEYDSEWANTDLDIQLAALDAVGADTIDDAVPYSVDYTVLGDFELEMMCGLWKDLMSVVAHKEHELGL